MQGYNINGAMAQILLPLAMCLAVIAKAQIPSDQLLRVENAHKNSNLNTNIPPGPNFAPHHLPPVNTLQQVPVGRQHMFHPSLHHPSHQTPAIGRTPVPQVTLTPKTDENFPVLQGMVPTNMMHFNPNNHVAMTAPDTLVQGIPLISAPGIPSKPLAPPDPQAGASKANEMNAEDLSRLTQPIGTKERTPPNISSEAAVMANLATGTRSGLCPATQCTAQHLAKQARMCYSDLDCQATQRCCIDHCWGFPTCATPVYQPSAMVCPPQDPCPPLDFKVICSTDSDCYPAFGAKCCMDQCLGKGVCKHPVLGPPPVAPSPWWPPITVPVRPPPDKCKVYCYGTKECCDSGYNLGYCPSPSLCYTSEQAADLLHNFTPCGEDQHCRASEKCCPSRCHDRMMCLPTVGNPDNHPGSCPAPSACNQLEERDLNRCTDDRHCYLSQRCCSSSCFPGQSLCKDSVRGVPGSNTSLPSPGCTTLCPGTHYCCDNETKPGFCPTTRQCSGVTMPAPVCTSDFNCWDDMKCCPNSCTGLNECRAPASDREDHAGFCPALNCPGYVPPIGHVNQCEIDTDCYVHQKCCPDCANNLSCETALTAPAPPCRLLCLDKKTCCDGKEKDGFCPAPAQCIPEPSGGVSEQACTEDYECLNSEKCCHDVCRGKKICHLPVASAGAHPGVCPTTPCDAPGPKFICYQDSDCPLHARCCQTATGRNECQATNCAQMQRFTPYNAPNTNTVQAFQASSPPYNSKPWLQNPAPPSTNTGNPASNKYPVPPVPVPGLPSTTGTGTRLPPLTNPGMSQNLLPPPPRRPPSGSTNYPDSSQPIRNRYTWLNSQGYQPQVPIPQSSESMQSIPGRSAPRRAKQRPKYRRASQSAHENSEFI